MGTFLLQASGCMILFYGIYFLFLRKLTFFEFNRWFLLGSLMMSLLIPLIAPYFIVEKPPLLTYNLADFQVTGQFKKEETGLTFLEIIIAILKVTYFLGVGVAFLRFCKGIYKIYGLYQTGEKVNLNGLHFVYSDQVHLPFSFLKTIYLSRNLPLSAEINQVILHERVHISRLHTLDVVLTELIHTAFWFNPIIIFYKRALKASHEFIADAVVTTATDKQTYLQTLLNQSVAGLQIELTNQFFNSQIKKRLEMMNMKSSNKKSLVRYMMIIPLVLVLGIIFASSKMSDAADVAVVETEIQSDTLPNEAVYYINDVLSTKEAVGQLKSEEILSVNVIKPTSEMEGYDGEKHDGVILVYTNRLHDIPKDAEFYINDKKVSRAEMDQLDPTEIVTINVVGKRQGINTEQVKVYTKDAKFIPKMPSPPPPPAAPGHQMAPPPPPAPGHHMAPSPPPPPAPPTPPAPKFGEVNVMGYFKTADQNAEVFTVVDEMPILKGCETEASKEAKMACNTDKMMRTLFTSVKYPKEARDGGIEGTAVVKFVINTDGKIIDPVVLRDPGNQLGQAALNAVKEMQKTTIFNPGKQNGKAVNVAYTLPVKFKLEGDEKPANMFTVKGTQGFQKDEPLFIVDGKEIPSFDIKIIDPNNIESIEVLKDKVATTKYGEKAKFGVVIINTKDQKGVTEVKTKGKTNNLDEMVVVGYGTKKDNNSNVNPTQSKKPNEIEVVGYETKNDFEIKAYPNPAHDKVTVDFNPVGKEDITIEAYTVEGKLVKKDVIKVNQKSMSYTLDVSGINDSKMLIITVKQGKLVSGQRIVLSK
ncbi:MAG: TonB family protein [Saprospiraceae bacterium]|nr:TonB family protein [Saprospiraceae bacterium]